MSTPASRTARSARNAGASILVQIVVIALGFITRTVFVAELGVAMLGVNTLLTSTLALLAIAELGVSGAFMFALYKPLSDGDTQKISIIVGYASRLYRLVALIVAVTGLALAPFIHQLVRLEDDIKELEIYYLILLVNTVVGYLMQNRLILLNADQKIYLTKIYSLIFNVIRSVAQIVSLLIFESFIIFLAIQVIVTVANNLVVYLRAGHLYPYLRSPPAPIRELERRSIMRSTRALVIYRIGGLALSNSTPLLISVIVGTVALGYYSNYILIVSSAVMIIEVAFLALTPSIGNLVAEGDPCRGRRVFDEVVLLSVLFHGIAAIGIITLVDDFVILWLGFDFVLPPEVAIATVFNFYIAGTLMPLWSFRSATGLFRRTQWVIAITAVLSIAMSFTLGPIFGLAGVVVAPAVARLITGAWYEPWLLIRDHLNGKLLPYFGLQLGAFMLWSVIAMLVMLLGEMVPGGTLVSMLVKTAFIAILFPVASWLVFHRTSAFRPLIRRLMALIQEIKFRTRRGAL